MVGPLLLLLGFFDLLSEMFHIYWLSFTSGGFSRKPRGVSFYRAFAVQELCPRPVSECSCARAASSRNLTWSGELFISVLAILTALLASPLACGW